MTARLALVIALFALAAGCAPRAPLKDQSRYANPPPAVDDPSKFGGEAAYPYGRYR